LSPVARNERLLLLLGAAGFVAVAVLGWRNLPNGFNFLDEGMYMTDAWRLTAGDRLFPDNAPSALRLYVVFNAAVFELFPRITLLGFRELQFVLALLAAAAMGAALWRWTGRAWPVPYVMSLYAFTGLHVKGMVPALSYHTYPHLFFTLYMALLLLALKSGSPARRAAWLLAAGTCLWAVGFSLFPLVAGAAAPVVLWALARWLRAEGPSFTVRDLGLVLAPVVALWAAFLAVYRGAFFDAVRVNAQYLREGGEHGLTLDPGAWPYIAGGALFLLAALGAFRLRPWAAACALGAAAAVMGWAVPTNLGHLVPAYWHGFFSMPMWFAGVLIAFLLLFFMGALAERGRRGACGAHAGLPLIVVSQVAVFGLIFSQVSDSHALAVTYLAIPASAALAVYLMDRMPAGAGASVRALLLAAFLLPLYGWTAWADWRFTYFDLPPELLTYTIPDGFAKGIRTNRTFGAMVRWITESARQYAAPRDFAVFLDWAPMGHMLTRLRPALNHSWIGLGRSAALQADAVAQMERAGRGPVVAYRFLTFPAFLPDPGAPGRYSVRRGIPPDADDPMSRYVATHMRPVDQFRVNGEPWIDLYVAGAPAPPAPASTPAQGAH
jgi:hypothetical protein